MNLQETVSKILGKKVSIDEAKDFANNQFGILTSFLKRDMVEKPTKEKKDEIKSMIIKNYGLHERGRLTYAEEDVIDLYVNEDHVDEIGQAFFS